MTKYFEVRVRREKILETGETRPVTERYITDALSVTEAEARVTQEIVPYTTGFFTILSAAEVKYAEVICTADVDHWYKCTYSLITLDEKTAREKRNTVNLLIGAETLDGALKALKDLLKQCQADTEITGVTETKIVDFIYYGGKENV